MSKRTKYDIGLITGVDNTSIADKEEHVKQSIAPYLLDDQSRVDNIESYGSSEKQLNIRRNSKETENLMEALLLKQMSIHILETDSGNSLYYAVSYALTLLPSPFNMWYPINVLRFKTAQYMIGHKSRFVKKMLKEDQFSGYCHRVATTQMQASSIPEAFALANALQVKIQIYLWFKDAKEHFLVDEHGELYSQVIKLAYINSLQEFHPIVDVK
jgi:hypothetical protein